MTLAAFLAVAALHLMAVIWAAALFGLTLLFEATPAPLWTLKLAGGAYLVWMAWTMWRHAAEPLDVSATARRAVRDRCSGLAW